jgi:hypothetical protein
MSPSADSPSEFAVVGQGSERVDVVELTQEVLQAAGVPTERHGDDLHLVDLGLVFAPRCISVDADDDGVSTVTIVRTKHAVAFPSGTFEYQHGAGDDLRSALRFGLEDWAAVDLPVLCEVPLEKPRTCSELTMKFPTDDGRLLVRRVLLGPVKAFAENPPADADREQHGLFCGCCMMTSALEQFLPHLKATDSKGIRLYAARDGDGIAMADCRVNGEDFDEGKAALTEYARAWPDWGIQFRKQYAVILNGT